MVKESITEAVRNRKLARTEHLSYDADVKKLTAAQWSMIKAMVDGGIRPVDIVRRMPSMVTARQIYAKKRLWERESYFKDPKNAVYHTPEYKAWRLAVFRRDGFKCKWCGRSGRRVRLEADHILPQSTHPQLRYKVSNGRTLCRRCHRKTPTFGLKALRYKGKLQ